MKTNLKNLSDHDLTAWLQTRGEPAFRCRQIRHWLYKRWAMASSEMTNLPQPLRDDLAETFRVFSLNLRQTLEADDDTRKFLFELRDGETIETVLLKTARRSTVCVSTQVGCPVRCAFCASGRHGLIRNLDTAEIIDQIVYACRELGERVNNIVVMGMGEPLLNLDALLPALHRVNAADGLEIGARHITISTSGIVPGIRTLAELGRQWNLALSLHAASEATRRNLIPDAYRYPLGDVVRACRQYREKTNRLVTLEYTLLKGRNDNESDVRALGRLATELRAKVNLIPCNPGETAFCRPERRRISGIEHQLDTMGVRVTVRRSRGEQIQAACGQLRTRV